jgi:hypothetical protein
VRFSEETLMAYADGELDRDTRAEIEEAMARDPELARAVERHRALAARIRGTYDGVLAEPVPEHLAALAGTGGSTPVADLAARRSAQRIAFGRMELPAWAALAASVAVGLFVGLLVARAPGGPDADVDEAFVARGALAEALTTQLATAPDGSGVTIGISFRDRDGDYCRSFHLDRDAALAGLACRRGEEWKLEVLAAAPPGGGELRTAGAMPIAVLRAVDAAIDGEPLDAAAEAAAREAGWRQAPKMAE